MRVILNDIRKRYGPLTVVDGVSLAIEDGEFFTLLGPSGCGKTTLLRLVAGFVRPDGGEIAFGDQPMTNVPPPPAGKRAWSSRATPCSPR